MGKIWLAPALAGAVALGACANPVYVRQDASKAGIDRDLKVCAAELSREKTPPDDPNKDDPKKKADPARKTSALPTTPHDRAKGQTAVAGLVIIFATSFARAAATTAIRAQQAYATAMRMCMRSKGYVDHKLTGEETAEWNALATEKERDAYRVKLWIKHYKDVLPGTDDAKPGNSFKRDPLKRGGRSN